MIEVIQSGYDERHGGPYDRALVMHITVDPMIRTTMWAIPIKVNGSN